MAVIGVQVFLLLLLKYSLSVRRPALQSFATPGFQSNATKNKARSDVVCVSSDSTSPTSSLKRDSSDLSLIGETVPHISKRQKKVPFEEKENIFTTSNKVNRVTREHFAPQNTDREVSGNKKSSDLSSDLVSVSTTFRFTFAVKFVDSFLY